MNVYHRQDGLHRLETSASRPTEEQTSNFHQIQLPTSNSKPTATLLKTPLPYSFLNSRYLHLKSNFMQLLDGNKLTRTIKEELKDQTDLLRASGKKVPHLAAILVGEDPASQTYVNWKVKDCKETGFDSTLIKFDATISEQTLLDKINELNEDDDIDGFIVQLPLPAHINKEKVLESINFRKDVDGFHPVNVGRMTLNLPCLQPATPFGILKLLERYEIETFGKHCVVVGRSNIVGMPMSIMMARNQQPGNCTVTLTHKYSRDLKEHTSKADILIVAIGKPEYITADMVKEGAVVIDVGINKVQDPATKSGFRLKGDIRFDEVAPKCSYITPVPGGVGPMTRVALLLNTWEAAQGTAFE